MLHLILGLICFCHYLQVENFEGMNLYNTLGVKPSITARDLYRLTRRYYQYKRKNPNPHDNTRRYLKEVEMAIDVLSTFSSRELYKRLGAQFLNFTGFQVTGYVPDCSLQTVKILYNNLADDFPGVPVFPVAFSLIEFFEGAEKTIMLEKHVPCVCDGGTRERCAKCKKTPFLPQLQPIKIQIPPGACDLYRIYGGGIYDFEITRACSDVLFVATCVDPPNVHRDGVNIYMNSTIPLADLFRGTTATIENVDGEELEVDVSNFFNSPDVFIRYKGMPYMLNPNFRGDLYLHITPELPKSLTPEQIKIIQDILPDDMSQYA